MKATIMLNRLRRRKRNKYTLPTRMMNEYKEGVKQMKRRISMMLKKLWVEMMRKKEMVCCWCNKPIKETENNM